MTALSMPSLTLTEFLDWENEQAERHEFHRARCSRWSAAGDSTVVWSLIC